MRGIARMLIVVVACACWGLGIVLTVKSHLGIGPWDVLQVAVSKLSGLSLGTTALLIGVVLVVFTYLAADIRPSWGTVATMVLISAFTDLSYPYVPEPRGLLWRIAMLLGGTVTIGLATGLYLRADLGAGPRDAAMFAVCKLTRESVRLSRTLLEATVLALGALLGGPVGIGTLVCTLAIGPIVQFSLRLWRVVPGATAGKEVTALDPRR